MTLGTGDKHPIKDTLGTQTHVQMKTRFEVIGHSKSLSQLSKHRNLSETTCERHARPAWGADGHTAYVVVACLCISFLFC